ncbi:RND transporter [Betaproteobacteria bacterium GR16-43]|nr:RND transporter [Betaproteobacteria bacterium GR16-43]
MKSRILALVAAMTATVAFAAMELTEAEVRKVDLDTNKVTLKHGEIKNLEMPPMTMVFQVKEPEMARALKAGDKVMFSAEKVGGKLTIVHIEPVK